VKRALFLAAALLGAGACRPQAPPLESRLGRSEVRVWSAPYPLVRGVTVRGAGIPERLDRLGYTRVRRRPAAPGEYFWGEDRVWIYRHGHRWDGRDWRPLLLCLELDGFRGDVQAVVSASRRPLVHATDGAWLEPEVLAESLDGRRAPRIPVRL